MPTPSSRTTASTFLSFLALSACAACTLWPLRAEADPRTSIGISISSGPRPAYSSGRGTYYYGQAYTQPYYREPVHRERVYVTPPPVIYTAPPVYYGSVVPAPPVASTPYYAQPVPAPSPSVDARVVQVQDNLRRLGYYLGTVDGIFGAGTRNAIRSYQIDRGLPVTGRMDRDLLQDLGL